MSTKGKQNTQDNTIVFRNLMVGSEITNDSKQLILNVPKSFIAPNAPGVFRQVKNYAEVADIAKETGIMQRKVFSTLEK